MPTVVIGGLPIAVLDRLTSAKLMVEWALARQHSGEAPLYSTSANGQVLSLYASNPSVRRLFLASPLIHADGMPLVFASRLKCRMALPERVATTDLFHDVAKIAVERKASFYLLERILDRFARVQIVKVSSMATMCLGRPPLSGIGILAKRSFDVALAALGLLALAPLFAVVALLIKLDSRGPVFFASSATASTKSRSGS